jgi:hypothetical protein
MSHKQHHYMDFIENILLRSSNFIDHFNSSIQRTKTYIYIANKFIINGTLLTKEPE